MHHIITFLALSLLSCVPAQKQNVQTQEEKLFVQAITDYIHAIKKEHNSNFDTLYFNKHQDFPKIELPNKIENTEIALINFEGDFKKSTEKGSPRYINLLGWVNNNTADFIFVTFAADISHQFDYKINYKLNPSKSAFEIENSQFEYFLYKKD